MADVEIFKSGDLPGCCERIYYATSNWLYVWNSWIIPFLCKRILHILCISLLPVVMYNPMMVKGFFMW